MAVSYPSYWRFSRFRFFFDFRDDVASVFGLNAARMSSIFSAVTAFVSLARGVCRNMTLVSLVARLYLDALRCCCLLYTSDAADE